MAGKEKIQRREDDAAQLADAIVGLCDFAPQLTERERTAKFEALVRAIIQATGNPEPE